MTVHTRARAMAAALDEIGEGESQHGSSGIRPPTAAGSPSPLSEAPPPPGVEPRADATAQAPAGADADTASYGVRPENAGGAM